MAFDRIGSRTYVVQHNPNCPNPYLIRLVGDKAAAIDLQHPAVTQDRLGYGKTLEEAVEQALSNDTYSCLLCGKTTRVPHVCPLFYKDILI